jgi:hypothetical protein
MAGEIGRAVGEDARRYLIGMADMTPAVFI